MRIERCRSFVFLELFLLAVFTIQIRADVTYTWIGTPTGGDWLIASNWNPAGQPSYSGISGDRDTALVNSLPGAVLYNGTGGAWSLGIGSVNGTEGKLDIHGGAIKAPGGLDIASGAGGKGTVNVYSGTEHSARYLCPGFRGNGTLNMYGGFFRVTNTLRVAYYSTATGCINLYGGTISTANLYIPYAGSILVKDGVLLLDGDKTSDVQGYIAAGKIMAAPGYNLVLEYNGSKYPGVTAVYAADGAPAEIRDLYSDTWVATDAAGRNLPNYDQVGPPRANRQVGIFYWTWHTSQAGHPDNTVYDVTNIIAANPNAPEFTSSFAAPHHWGKPELGYYISTDKYVLKKHALMLAQAGVDVLIFDTTNGSFTFRESYLALLQAFTELALAGNKVPKIAFMCPFGDPMPVAEQVYTDLYQGGWYEYFWFHWKQKPLIMADPGKITNPQILNFFTCRRPMPSYFTGPTGPNQWGWLHVYPQPVFYGANASDIEQITVGVGQNALGGKLSCFSNINGAHGRSWHGGQKDPAPSSVLYGYNLQEQFERALAIDPPFIFITGWNEWVAGRYEKSPFDPDNEVSYYPQAHFPDQYTQEYSRDIEPMEGGHTDNYYYQMTANIRRYKGVRPPQSASASRTITIDGLFGEWDEVGPEFRDARGDTAHRNHRGYGTTYYVNTTGRNDLTTMKVARDSANIYFYAETAATLTPNTDSLWMLLFIDSDQDHATGWEGYDYVVNLNVAAQTTSLHRLTNGWNPVITARIPYAVNDNRLELAIPRAGLGLTPGCPVRLDFKWADNIQQLGRIDSFFNNGEASPPRRFKYRYIADPVAAEFNIADIDQDGRVDMSDLAVMSRQWIGLPGLPWADISGDGQINQADLLVLADNWLSQ